MRKKIFLLSIAAAVLLVVATYSSAVGTHTVPSKQTNVTSPLFTIRQQSFQNKEHSRVSTEYLGQGKIMNLFLKKTLTYQHGINRALRMVQTNPALLKMLIEKLENDPRVQSFIHQQGIEDVEFHNYANMIKNNPGMLEDEINKVKDHLPIGDGPMPLGLNDTNPFAVLILLLALLPLLLVLTIVIATVTIVTCLNIGGCFEALFENLVVGFFQGLTPA
jgi:hypothetical protein